MINLKHIFVFLVFVTNFQAMGQERAQGHQSQFDFKGQLSGWAHLNTNNPYPFYIGGRYIPQVNYSLDVRNDRLFDFVSALSG